MSASEILANKVLADKAPVPEGLPALNGVMMQFFHWYVKPDGSLWNELAEKADDLAAAGITSLWLPPAYFSRPPGKIFRSRVALVAFQRHRLQRICAGRV